MKNIIKKCWVGLLSLGILVAGSSELLARAYSAIVVGAPYAYGYPGYQLVDYTEADPYPYYPYFPAAPTYDQTQPYGVNPFHPLVNHRARRAPSHNSVYMY